MPKPLVRTRFAPSPTGYLHVGGLRTALFNYLYARKHEGIFVLRIEDTDRERLVLGAQAKILETLTAMNLSFDEGPGSKGKLGPYIQSERLPIYQKNAQDLLSKSKAYYCFCTPKRLAKLKEEQKAQNLPPRYDGHCRDLSAEASDSNFKSGKPYVVRFKMPRTGVTAFTDLVFGLKQFKNELLDDTILIKSDSYPVYNFANVVDDHLMEITHVIRGEEFVSSTPKHVLLYQAFGWGLPQFAHLPLLLDNERKKLSKRFGDVAVEEYLKKGYLPQAMLNFIALLGWNPKTTKEIFTLEELVEEFSLEKVNKSGAIFDVTKLNFINHEWQKRLNLKSLDPAFQQVLNTMLKDSIQVDEQILLVIWPQILERDTGAEGREQVAREFEFYFKEPVLDPKLLAWKEQSLESVKENLTALKEFLSTLPDEAFKKFELETKTKEFLKSRGAALGEALWPLRVALTGQKNSPGPFEILETLVLHFKAKEKAFARIDAAIAKIQ